MTSPQTLKGKQCNVSYEIYVFCCCCFVSIKHCIFIYVDKNKGNITISYSKKHMSFRDLSTLFVFTMAVCFPKVATKV